jgi:hypothetical protein
MAPGRAAPWQGCEAKSSQVLLVGNASRPSPQASGRVPEDTQREIARIQRGDAGLFETAGEDVHAHSGEEYRQELRRALERYGDQLKSLPGAAGSGMALGKERGHFFCARVDEQVFLRFVPWGADTTIARDSLACLRKITCVEGTPRVMPDDLQAGAYEAWKRARGDIFEEWQKATDPAAIQPPIRPLFRAAAAHVRQFPPSDARLEEVDRLIEALEAPWKGRIEKGLRAVFTPEEATGEATSRAIAGFVKAFGLQPWKAPEPLPPIDIEDVVLVVWMAVERRD